MSDDFHLFGKPGQPESQDFVALSDVVLHLDGLTEDADFDYGSFIGEIIDPETVIYVAQQRVSRVLSQAGIPSRLVPALVSIWLDGFCVGNDWAERDH